MGLGILNVWIHDQFSPCKISDEFWYVNVSYCSGEYVEYCGKTYRGLDAKCGHAEFELPPGCYVVQAFQFQLIPVGKLKFPVFTYSDSALVMVECDAKACVHVYNHSLWWRIFLSREVDGFSQQKKAPLGRKLVNSPTPRMHCSRSYQRTLTTKPWNTQRRKQRQM